MRFFVGLHQPSDAQHFGAAFISVHRLKRRRTFVVQEWILDSGAFTTLDTYAGYPEPVACYAAEIVRWKDNGTLLAAVTQDYMCEPLMLAKTGLSVTEHQGLTLERYDALVAAHTGVYIMPVLQGYTPAEYVAHVTAYGRRLARGAWVGVGSICKRNGHPTAIEDVLLAIHQQRSDLRLHGFGLKTTALRSAIVQECLYSADSMAWSFQARKQGRNANDRREATRFCQHIATMPVQRRARQLSLFP